MKSARIFSVLAFFAVVVATGISAAQNPSDVLSEVNGVKITRADLEKAQGGKLLQPRYQLYMAEQKALDEVINNRLLEAEAASKKMTVEELLKKEVDAKVKEPSEDQLLLYYEDANTKEPFDSVKDKIIEYVKARRTARLKEQYIQLLRSRADVVLMLPPPRVDFTVGNAPRIGPENAPVQLVEFADYQCPYCVKMEPNLARLRKEFGDKISFYYKDLPLQMHPFAKKAAENARCAGGQGKFWEYHDLIFASTNLDEKALKKFATDLKLDLVKFNQCLESGEQSAVIQKDVMEAQQLGLSGTPTFFINGRYLSGVLDYDSLRDMVNQELALKNPDKGTQKIAGK